MKKSTIIKLPLIFGLSSGLIIFLLINFYSELTSAFLAVTIGLAYFGTGFLNHKKSFRFKEKTIRLLVFFISFWLAASIVGILDGGMIKAKLTHALFVSLVLLVNGFLMNIFLNMKKGHWIAIITLGLLVMFFMINSFISKQEVEMQIAIGNEQLKTAEEQKEIAMKLKAENDSLRELVRAKNLEIDALSNK